MSEIKRIGIMTSGGDCAGLNAVIRAVVHRAIWTYKWEVFGIIDSSEGLMLRPLRYRQLNISDFYQPYERLGGTMLGSINKGNPFAYKMPNGDIVDLTNEFGDGCRQLGLDALIVIGGDGSMAILSKLCKNANVRMVGIPKTIDNDTPVTDQSVGFSTARQVCVEALDRLQSTAASHKRVMIMEVMGRDTGHIALQSAIAGGADICIIPEVKYSYEGILNKLRLIRGEGGNHALVVVAEGAIPDDGCKLGIHYPGESFKYSGFGQYLCDRLNAEPDEFGCRVTSLGHVQRGGIPTAEDRLIANALGVKAVDLLAEGKTDHMVAWKGCEVTEVSLDEVARAGISNLDSTGEIVKTARVNPEGTLVKTAKSLGIYIGD